MNDVIKAISRKLGLIMVIWLSIGATTHGEIVRVQKDAAGSGDGTSWADAYNELRDALLEEPQGTEIWVATWEEEDWVYTPTADQDQGISFILRNNVEIYGGFLGTHHPSGGETSREQRDYENNVTTLSGDLGGGATSRVVVEGTDGVDFSAVLDGFTITGASEHGIENYKASPQLWNLIITRMGVTRRPRIRNPFCYNTLQ